MGCCSLGGFSLCWSLPVIRSTPSLSMNTGISRSGESAGKRLPACVHSISRSRSSRCASLIQCFSASSSSPVVNEPDSLLVWRNLCTYLRIHAVTRRSLAASLYHAMSSTVCDVELAAWRTSGTLFSSVAAEVLLGGERFGQKFSGNSIHAGPFHQRELSTSC